MARDLNISIEEDESPELTPALTRKQEVIKARESILFLHSSHPAIFVLSI